LGGDQVRDNVSSAIATPQFYPFFLQRLNYLGQKFSGDRLMHQQSLNGITGGGILHLAIQRNRHRHC